EPAPTVHVTFFLREGIVLKELYFVAIFNGRKGICMQLQNKGVLVTGGASGLGEACVRLLSQAGARVVIADLNEELGTALARELGNSALFVKTNVVEEESTQAAVKA